MITSSTRAEAGLGQAGNLALLSTLTVVWGLNWPPMKVVVAELPVPTFRTLCLGLAGAALLLIARAGGERVHVPRRLWRPLATAAFFNMFAWSMLTAVGLTMVEAGR